MLEKAVMMFGTDCIKDNSFLPSIITIYDGNKENPQPIAQIDFQFSKIILYDSNLLYLKNLKKLTSYYELMEGREVMGEKREVTITLEYR